jgi:hypothetical protein
MDEKITIIEGPPPTFELVDDIWANGIAEGPGLNNVAVTHLRTFNGNNLVERCHRAWRSRQPINLEFRTTEGGTMEAQIVAARNNQTQDGDMLVLWVRLPDNEIEIEFDFGDEDDEEYDEDHHDFE